MARNFVDDGGPDRWIKGLQNGRSETVLNHADEIETLWGVRHLLDIP